MYLDEGQSKNSDNGAMFQKILLESEVLDT